MLQRGRGILSKRLMLHRVGEDLRNVHTDGLERHILLNVKEAIVLEC